MEANLQLERVQERGPSHTSAEMLCSDKERSSCVLEMDELM